MNAPKVSNPATRETFINFCMAMDFTAEVFSSKKEFPITPMMR